MKRFRRMMPLNQITDQVARTTQNEDMRDLWLLALCQRVLGDALAARITRVQLRGRLLRVEVNDPLWRRTLRGQSARVLRRLQEEMPRIGNIQWVENLDESQP